MSKEYAENRIKEALKKHNDNNTRATQQVMAWAYEDHKLLAELTKIHLKGITAYWIDRVKSNRGAPKETPETPVIEMTTKKGNKKSEHTFGEEMLRSFVARKGETFGLEDSVGNLGKRTASKTHVDAIQVIAQKSKSKQSDDQSQE